MTNEKKYLPLGSVVILEGGLKKLMIVSRGNVLNDNYFDYGAVLYPEGMIDDNIAYFNETDILKIIHEGYEDEDNSLMIEAINRAYESYSSQPESKAELIEENVTEEDDPFASVRDLEE